MGRASCVAQEALAIGLKGPVHSVLTEEFTSEGGVRREPSGSVLEIYDREGYQVEGYRYKPDGSLWVHTVIDRKGPLVSRMQVRSEEHTSELQSRVDLVW